MIEWLGTLDDAGPLAQAELCKLVERGDDALTQAIFHQSRLEDPTADLYALARHALASPCADVRSAAIVALGIHSGIMPEPVCDAIAALAADPDVGVRCSVANAVGDRRASVALRLIEDPDEEVRHGAALALAHFKEHVDLAESVAQAIVVDRGARVGIRELAAELFRDTERIRAAYARLVREGVTAPLPAGPIFSGAPLRDKVLN